MILSTVQSRKPPVEATRTAGLIPEQLRDSAESLISFVEDYYKYLNSVGGPSSEIENINSNLDLDRTSAFYLAKIKEEIAKNVPSAQSINEVLLYKNIVKYYLSKSSEDGVLSFFRIFYNAIVEIEYPKERLFRLSAGNWDTDSYKDRKGFLSDVGRIQDSFFWQDFSYSVKTDLTLEEWGDNFSTLAHPAGFKFFGIISLLVVAKNEWLGRFATYNSDTKKYEISLPDGSTLGTPKYFTQYSNFDPEINLDWMKSLIAPDGGYYMPLFQPGLMGQIILKELLIKAMAYDNETFARFIIYATELLSVSDPAYQIKRNDFITNGKHLETGPIGQYGEVRVSAGGLIQPFDISEFSQLSALVDYVGAPSTGITTLDGDLELTTQDGTILTFLVPDDLSYPTIRSELEYGIYANNAPLTTLSGDAILIL